MLGWAVVLASHAITSTVKPWPITVLTVISALEPLLPVQTAGHPCDAAGAPPFSCSCGAAAMWAFDWTGFEMIQARIGPF